MSGKTPLRAGSPGYPTMWNLEELSRRVAALESSSSSVVTALAAALAALTLRVVALEARVDKSGTSLPASGDFFGQKFYITTTGKWYAWNGSGWTGLNITYFE